MFKILSTVAAVMMLASSALAGATALKSGECEFQLLDAKGIRPLSQAQLRLITDDGTVAAEATSDRTGKCTITAKSGEYLVAVGDKGIAVVSFNSASKRTVCKVIVPEKGKVVIGQAVTGGLIATGVGGASTAGVVSGALAAVGGVVGGGAVIGSTVLLGGAAALGGGIAAAVSNNKNDEASTTSAGSKAFGDNTQDDAGDTP
jgi:hypothetical protein